MTGTGGINSASNAYYVQLQQLLASGSSSSNAAIASGPASGSSVSAEISPAGQLFSNLQALQTQDPAKFKDVVGQIADQLSSAAQQQSPSGASNFLTNLADKFQNVASGGDVSQLQPHHHHGHHGGHHSYNSAGQGVTSTTSTASADSAGATLEQLFANINNEVTQALAS
jgi:hypothetical protein